MIKAVLFDLDGTLANSIEDLADSTNKALKAMGFPGHTVGEYKYFVGDGIPKLIELCRKTGAIRKQRTPALSFLWRITGCIITIKQMHMTGYGKCFPN